MELLVADQPPRADAHDSGSRLWDWAERMAVEAGRFPARAQPAADWLHPAMAVQLDACIQCTLCVRACRGMISAENRATRDNIALIWHYVTLQGLTGFLVIRGLLLVME